MTSPPRTALVTGASGAIGGALCRALSGQFEALSLVYCQDQGPAAEIAAAIQDSGGRALLLQAELRDPDQRDALVAETLSAFGRIDALVNCAGIVRDELLVKLRDDEWSEVFETGVYSAFALVRTAARAMIRRRSGCILNVSSISASVPAPGQAVYAASKGALEALTRAAAVELGPKGIRVNAIAPGRIESPMTERVHEREKNRLLDRIPLRRYGTPAEVAKAAAFLLSDEAAYITGQVLTVDGGLSLAAKS